MKRGPFWKIIRPDEPTARPKPFTVSGYIVDQWRHMAYGGLVIGVLGLATGGAGFWYGMHKEKAPPEAIVSLIDRTGRLVDTYVVGDGEMPEPLVNANLCEIVWNLRTLTPDQPVERGLLDKVNLYFAGNAALKLRAFFRDRDFFKPMISQRFHRVVDEPINCQRVAGSEDHYRIDWAESVSRDSGQVVDGTAKKQFMEVVVSRQKKVPPEIRRRNPTGMLISDFSWSVTD